MNYAGFVEIGYIQKTHGIKGELQVSWNDSLTVNPQDLESVFVEIDGIPIPFFISSLKQKNYENSIARFDEVDNLQSAEELVGHSLMLPANQIPENDDLELKDLVGYTVIDTANCTIGVISGYEEFNLNSIYYITTPNGSEAIIPATDDLIIEVDVEAKRLTMQIPEGLLNVYSKD